MGTGSGRIASPVKPLKIGFYSDTPNHPQSAINLLFFPAGRVFIGIALDQLFKLPFYAVRDKQRQQTPQAGENLLFCHS